MMGEQPKNGLASLWALAGEPSLTEAIERKKAEKARQEAEDRAFHDYCYKRLARFKNWAMKQDKEALAEHLSLAALLLIEKKKTERVVQNSASLREEMIYVLEKENGVRKAHEAAAMEIANDQIRKLLIHKDARRRGADVTNRAKRTAQEAVKEHWDRMSVKEQAAHGAVIKFATKTVLEVPGTTVDGIRRWVAKWRRQTSNR
ncbi:hypothetical protein [Xanthomonas sp. LMG 12459]|nr:hypothetical protein [Xanthomonas sp. LMG 12459]